RGRGFGWRSWDPWFGDPFWADSIDIHTVDRYEANAEILMGKGPKPADNRRAFDARDVLARLGPSIEMPREGRH
ncbi:MAG: CC0125/CC1285 family lipoprotein, partial [Allosphingosinicella sp.]